MPFDRKEYMRLYDIEKRKNHKEKLAKQQKDYYERNKEKIKQKQNEYYVKNKEKIKQKKNDENVVKTRILCGWRRYGVKHNNFNELYDYYKSVIKCELCDCDFNVSKKCLDHDHRTGYFRCVCCNNCNIKRPRIERLHLEVMLELHRYFKLN